MCNSNAIYHAFIPHPRTFLPQGRAVRGEGMYKRVGTGGGGVEGRDGIKARKSSVSKMNGSGIDDAEGARAPERERVSKNLPSKKSASAVGEKSLMDHSFLFGAPLCYFSCVSGRRGSGIPTLSRDKEFMPANGISRLFPLDAEQRCK